MAKSKMMTKTTTAKKSLPAGAFSVEFKGQQILRFGEGDYVPSMGVSKARKVVELVDDHGLEPEEVRSVVTTFTNQGYKFNSVDPALLVEACRVFAEQNPATNGNGKK